MTFRCVLLIILNVLRWIKKCFLKAHWTIAMTFVCRREKMQQNWEWGDFTCAKSIENWETIKLKVHLRLSAVLGACWFSLNGDCLLPKSTSFRQQTTAQNLIWIMFNFQFCEWSIFCVILSFLMFSKDFDASKDKKPDLTYLKQSIQINPQKKLKLYPCLGYDFDKIIICDLHSIILICSINSSRNSHLDLILFVVWFHFLTFVLIILVR